jgi:hypothetical protein
MVKETLSIAQIVNNDGCFDLQFRKDTRHERSGSPTYYRWKIQFVVTTPKENVKTLEKIKRELACGTIYISKDQARFSVQNINEIAQIIVPFFQKNSLGERKKKDFSLWKKAVEIIWQNKGQRLSVWKKHDLLQLIQIHKSTAKYKQKPKKAKWMDMAETLTKKEA